MISTRFLAASRRSLLIQRINYTGTTCTGSLNTFSTVTSTTEGGDSYVSPLKGFFDMVEKGDSFGALDYQDNSQSMLKCGIAEDALRFRTEHYGRLQLAPYVQPWEHRVTVRIALQDMPIESELEQQLIADIVGSRLRDDTLQLSSNQFGSRIENKRHLVSMLDRIVLGAKRLAKEIQSGQQASPPHQVEEQQSS
jgi:hypothetical protein